MLQAFPANLLPISPVPLDYDNAFAESCRLAFVGSMMGVTRGNDYPLTYDSGVTFPLGLYGHQMRGTTTADGAKIASAGIGSVLSGSSPLTCMMLVRVATTGSRRILIGDYDSAGNNGAFSIEQTATSKWRMLVVNTTPISLEFTSGTSVTTGWHWVEFTQNSSSLVGYVDGAQVGFQTMTGSRRAGNDLRIGRGGAFTSVGFDGDIACCYIFDRVLSDQERLWVRTNPGQIFRYPQNRSKVGVAASSFSVAISEALSAADSASAALIASAAISEAMAAADATLAAMIAAVSASESVTASDTVSGANVTPVSLTESVTATDAQSAAMTAAHAIAESVTATDTSAGALTAAVTVSEAASLTDALSGSVGLLTASVAETVSLADAPSVTLTAAVAVAEAVSLTDVMIGAGLRIYTGAVIEAMSTSDAWSAVIGGGEFVSIPRSRRIGGNSITGINARIGGNSITGINIRIGGITLRPINTRIGD